MPNVLAHRFWTVCPLIRIIPSFNTKGCSAQVRRRQASERRNLQRRLCPKLCRILSTRRDKDQKGIVSGSGTIADSIISLLSVCAAFLIKTS